MKIHNPATGEVLADVEADTNAAVRKKYKRARAAQPDWAARSHQEAAWRRSLRSASASSRCTKRSHAR